MSHGICSSYLATHSTDPGVLIYAFHIFASLLHPRQGSYVESNLDSTRTQTWTLTLIANLTRTRTPCDTQTDSDHCWRLFRLGLTSGPSFNLGLRPGLARNISFSLKVIGACWLFFSRQLWSCKMSPKASSHIVKGPRWQESRLLKAGRITRSPYRPHTKGRSFGEGLRVPGNVIQCNISK